MYLFEATPQAAMRTAIIFSAIRRGLEMKTDTSSNRTPRSRSVMCLALIAEGNFICRC